MKETINRVLNQHLRLLIIRLEAVNQLLNTRLITTREEVRNKEALQLTILNLSQRREDQTQDSFRNSILLLDSLCTILRPAPKFLQLLELLQF